MSHEIWLKQDDLKMVCFVGTARDQNRGSWDKKSAAAVLTFIVQNEGKTISVIDGHEASYLVAQKGYTAVDR